MLLSTRIGWFGKFEKLIHALHAMEKPHESCPLQGWRTSPRMVDERGGESRGTVENGRSRRPPIACIKFRRFRIHCRGCILMPPAQITQDAITASLYWGTMARLRMSTGKRSNKYYAEELEALATRRKQPLTPRQRL